MNPWTSITLPTVLVTLMVGTAPALAQPKSQLPGNYPSKPIRILVGGSPGGGTDIIARLVGHKLSEKWGHPVVIENRASGLGSIIAMQITATAPADAYTLHLANSSAYMNAALITKVPYDVRTAFSPIVQLTAQPYILTINAQLPVNSVRELIAYAKTKPAGLNYGTAGNGTASHLGMELLKSMAKVDMVQVNYKGSGQALIDLMSGQVALIFSSTISVMPLAKGGKLRALAVASATRSKLLPDIPTVAESGLPGFELTGWYGLITGAGSPSVTVLALNREVSEIMNIAEMREKLAADGAEVAPRNSPMQFRETINKEIDKWDRVIKQANLKF